MFIYKAHGGSVRKGMPVLSSQINCRSPTNTQASYGIKKYIYISGSITSWQTDGEKVETVTF